MNRINITGNHRIADTIKRSLLLPTFMICFALFNPFPSSAAVTLTYEYNALDRLSVAGYGTSFTETYTYDPTGNRTGLAVSTGQKLQRTSVPSKSTKAGSQK